MSNRDFFEQEMRRQFRMTRRMVLVLSLALAILAFVIISLLPEKQNPSVAPTNYAVPELRGSAFFDMDGLWEYKVECRTPTDDYLMLPKVLANFTIKDDLKNTVAYRTSSRDVDVMGGLKLPDPYYAMYLVEDALDKTQLNNTVRIGDRVICGANIPDITLEIHDEGDAHKRTYMSGRYITLATCDTHYEQPDGTFIFNCVPGKGWDEQRGVISQYIDDFVKDTYGASS